MGMTVPKIIKTIVIMKIIITMMMVMRLKTGDQIKI